MPKYANPGDAGMDLFAVEYTEIGPEETVLIRTGIKLAIPEGYEIQIRPRSSVSSKTPLRIPNSPGTIDAGYRGEILVPIFNCRPCIDHKCPTYCLSDVLNFKALKNKSGIYVIEPGDKIAQMILSEVPRMELELVDDVTAWGYNRNGGFGSTGAR